MIVVPLTPPQGVVVDPQLVVGVVLGPPERVDGWDGAGALQVVQNSTGQTVTYRVAVTMTVSSPPQPAPA